MGVNISKAIGVKTEIRMLVCGSHRIFYKADDYISVYRILNCRMSYINILFE